MKTPNAVALAALLIALAACATAPPRPAATRREKAARTSASGAVASQEATAGSSASAKPEERAALEALPPRAQRLWNDALESLEEQKKLKVPTDWALVEKKFRNVLSAADVAEAHFNIGVALDAQGKKSEARDEYRRALAQKPWLRQAAANIAVLQEKEGDASGAAAAYAEIARAHPEDAVARERLGALYVASGQLDEAWRLARESLQRDPASAGAYKVLVRVALRRNQLDLAKLISLKAQKLAPNDPEVAFFHGQILAGQGDEAGAKAQYAKALSLREDFLPARYALLAGAVKSESWVNVAEHARAVLKEKPEDAPVVLALGIALRRLGKNDEALAAYGRAEKLAGGRLPEIHLARGVFLMKVKSEYEPAIAEFDAYAKAAGPTVAGDAPVFKLRRECEEIIVQNKQAAEAAKEMQREAERKAAEEAAKKAGEGAKKPPTEPAKKAEESPAGGGTVPTSAPLK